MKMTIKWADGTYTFDHKDKIITNNTLQTNIACDNITEEINDIFKELENYE